MKLHHMMRMFVSLGLALFFFSLGAPELHAQPNKFSIKQKSEMQVAPGQKPQLPATRSKAPDLPDLTVLSASWSAMPKAGDKIGTDFILYISVHNHGLADAAASKMKITCKTLSGEACPAVLTGTRDVQPLTPGMSVKYSWPSASSDSKWGVGKYRIGIVLDSANQVAEQDETDNEHKLFITVRPGMMSSAAQSGQNMAQVKPGAQITEILSKTIPVLMPVAGSKITYDKPAVIKWNKGFIKNYLNVRIEMVDGQTGTIIDPIDSNAINSGEYTTWTPPSNLWPGRTYKIRITTTDNKFSGLSGVFDIVSPPPKKKYFSIDATIINSFAQQKSGNTNSPDCLNVPSSNLGPAPGSNDARIGHSLQALKHGDCSVTERYHLRSRLYFDVSSLAGKEIIEANLMIRKGSTFILKPEGFPASNTDQASRCDIYLLSGPWPVSPQQLDNFFQGAFLKSFTLFGQGETELVDLTSVVRDWTAVGGKPNHGLMLRDPLENSIHYLGADIKLYHSIKLMGSYME